MRPAKTKGDIKMNMHEYNDRVQERNRVESEYSNPKWDAIHNAYIAIDLHKDQFCRMVDAIGWEQITNKSGYWQYVRDAVEEKQARDERERRAVRLREIEAEIKRLQGEAEELLVA
jgi:hypothetical protein